jgi:antitoxin PrlF
MDVPAKITSKGQITVPKSVRDALGLKAGDRVLFRIHAKRAVLAKTPDFLTLGGTVPVPASKHGTAWSEVTATTWRKRAATRR